MTTRKRSRFIPEKGAGGGGGGGPAPTALVAWGPDFGESSDDNTWDTEVANDGLDALEYTGDLDSSGALDLDALEYTGDLASTGALDLDALEYTGNASSTLRHGHKTFLNSQNLLTVQNLHYAKNTGNSAVGLINPREDSPNTNHGVAANQSANNYLGFGMGSSPFNATIRPETVQGVTNDERVMYVYFDLTQIQPSSDFPTSLGFGQINVTNPSLVASTTLTIFGRSTTSLPWPLGATSISWNAVEPITVGDQVANYTEVVAANTTRQVDLGATSTVAPLKGRYVYFKITSSLAGALVTVSTINTSGNPNSTPQDNAPHFDSIEWREIT